MEEEQLTIQFDVKTLHTNIIKRLLVKIKQILVAFVKRVFEIFVSILGLILLVPLTIFVAIKNAINKDNGPIFYTQNRIGKNGKHIKINPRDNRLIADEDTKSNETAFKFRLISYY